MQYEAKFRTLERFTSNLVPIERQRVECFYEGLYYDIHVALIDMTFVTFNDVVRATSEAKQVLVIRPCRDNDPRQQHP